MHHTLFPVHFIGMLGLGLPELIIVVVVTMFPMLIIGIVATALYFKHQQRRMWSETVRIALEKGQPIPPYPGQQRHEIEKSWHEFAMRQATKNKKFRRSSRLRDVRAGLVMLAIGAAVHLATPPGSNDARYALFTYVPAFIGVALLLNGLLDAVFSRNKDDPGTQPPQS